MAAFAARYARAFAQVAAATNLDLGAVQQQMSAFAATLAGSRELREVLMNPALANQQKLKVIDAIASRLGMERAVRNFIAVIMDHQRLGELDGIVAEYAALADVTSGLTEVEVTSSRPLDQAERETMMVKAGELAGSRVNASFYEDASLLGGVVLKIGSTVYDGSLKAQFAGLKHQLMAVPAR